MSTELGLKQTGLTLMEPYVRTKLLLNSEMWEGFNLNGG